MALSLLLTAVLTAMLIAMWAAALFPARKLASARMTFRA
jgi:hypothetical protein